MTEVPTSYEVERIGAVPPLGRTYRRVLGRTAQAVIGAGSAGSLPKVALRSGTTTPDAAHLTAYQQLVGAPVDDTLPPGFVHVLGFPLAVALMARTDFPFSPLGMIHVSNRVIQRRPVRLGEPLTLTAWAHDAREHRRGTTVELSVTAEVGGEPVWSGRSTYLSKGAVPAGLEREPLPADADDQRGRREDAIPAQPQALWTVTEADIHTYAQVSGDHNPIHTSWLGARAFGFRQRIAHGMYTAARALHAAGRPGSTIWDVEFGSPVPLPSKVAFAQVSAGASVATKGAVTGQEESVPRDVTPRRKMVVWDPRRGKVHLTAGVTPLDV
ncbi:MAG: MaoC family dehydratase [Actinomycetaceae bacterium]